MKIQNIRTIADVPADWRLSAAHRQPSISGTVFHAPWWMEAASGGNWGEATVTSNGEVIARLPYVKKRVLGLSAIGMPPLTHMLGPQLPVVDGGDASFSTRRTLLTELMAGLPTHKYFNQICHPGIADTLPLYALGYDSGLKYSLRIAPAASQARILKGMRKQIRYDVRKAEQMLTVQTDLGIDEFCHFYNACTRANNKQYWSQRFIKRIDALKTRIYEACIKNNAGCLLAARDDTGVLRAAIMLVWGDGVMYYHLSAHDGQPQGAGSVKLLIWESLKRAHERGMIFDLDGMPRPGATNILTGFGGTVSNRIVVTKIPPAIHIARQLASSLPFGL
jgi:hypothetical protein